VLKEHQAGIPIVELCRKHGISDATFYTWRTKYGGMAMMKIARKAKPTSLISSIVIQIVVMRIWHD